MSQVEWKEVRLGDVCIVLNGRAYSQPELLNSGKYKVLRVGNLVGGDKFYYSDMELEENKYCFDGDLLYAWACSFDSYIWKEGKTIFHYHIWKLLPKEDVLDKKFFYFYLKYVTPRLLGKTNGSVMQHITKDLFEKTELSLPPLEEQKRIAGILSSLDDKIELNNKINDNLEKQAQLLYSEMFIEEPDVPLGSVVITTSGGTPNRKESSFYTNGSICWVKSKELLGSFILDTEEKITEVALNKSAAKKIPANSVMIAMYGATVGEYGIISKEMTCNQAICALVENEKYPYTYLFMYTKMHKQELINMAVGSAQQNISQLIIKEMLVHSDLDKIQAYHAKTDSLFQEMKMIQEENQRLTILRDTLLPKLMSGESL
ncbi:MULTISPECIES: restriction endonuclease subunit S [unclassified Fibrobacter]|uniref:restriction endonuclease subunit S n=1 Tax=unclassified Fibrobacter TaxID=2634177 RepID=UPI000D6C2AD7|nr:MULTISPECIES: restriction endonuclease subunit S [unclassified Fibrobacter]PWJ58126.1 type I restriction enzyme S subunit [Fibrobacter sp. UWR4]PZW62827.1 type I restriction enzyme S subunit [Fibrobacter sp. UWR1]